LIVLIRLWFHSQVGPRVPTIDMRIGDALGWLRVAGVFARIAAGLPRSRCEKVASYASAEIISPLLSDDKNILIAEYPWRASA
jgi:hypothetical protein